MPQEYNRIPQMSDALQTYMADCFTNTCQSIQSEIDEHANKVWSELRSILSGIMSNVCNMQKQHQKGGIQYLSFSFMNYSVYLNKIEIRIDALDDSFYLDEQEAWGYYCPFFLQDKYLKDLDMLHKKMSELFVRVQDYEFQEIAKQYAGYFTPIIYGMVKSQSDLMLEVIAESGANISDNFKIICGEYMDRAAVLYTIKTGEMQK